MRLITLLVTLALTTLSCYGAGLYVTYPTNLYLRWQNWEPSKDDEIFGAPAVEVPHSLKWTSIDGKELVRLELVTNVTQVVQTNLVNNAGQPWVATSTSRVVRVISPFLDFYGNMKSRTQEVEVAHLGSMGRWKDPDQDKWDLVISNLTVVRAVLSNALYSLTNKSR